MSMLSKMPSKMPMPSKNSRAKNNRHSASEILALPNEDGGSTFARRVPIQTETHRDY